MFAWISRFNGSVPELGTQNNTVMRGTERQILRYAREYGPDFLQVNVSIHYDENTKYGKCDHFVVIFP